MKRGARRAPVYVSVTHTVIDPRDTEELAEIALTVRATVYPEDRYPEGSYPVSPEFEVTAVEVDGADVVGEWLEEGLDDLSTVDRETIECALLDMAYDAWEGADQECDDDGGDARP